MNSPEKSMLQSARHGAICGGLASFASMAVGLAVALATLLMATPAKAGRPCEDKPPQVSAVAKGMELAAHTAKALDASGAQVLVLARAGQDLSKYGLNYSHLGFVYRDEATAGKSGPAVWRVVHKLNQCGTATATLYRQGLGEFFLDSPFRYEAAFVALTPELQAKLLPLLQDNSRAAQLNEPRYNMLAYPWGTRYQQSNQWAMEMLAVAANGSVTRTQAQYWLQQQGYKPTTLHLSALTRLGARVTAANVAFDDHPDAMRFSDRIQTVTVDSVFDWLPRAGLGAALVSVR